MHINILAHGPAELLRVRVHDGDADGGDQFAIISISVRVCQDSLVWVLNLFLVPTSAFWIVEA